MADLIGPQDLVGRYDYESRAFTVTGLVPGPAGSALIELPGGVDLDIDVAEPDRVASIIVPAPFAGSPRGLHPETLASLRALLGDARVLALFETTDGPTRRLGRTQPDSSLDDRVTRLGLALGAAGELGRAAHRGLALLEALVAARSLDRSVRPTFEVTDIDEAVAALTATDPDDLLDAGDIAALLRAAAEASPAHSRALLELADAVRRAQGAPHFAAAAAPPYAAMPSPVAAAPRAPTRLRVPLVVGHDRAHVRIDGDELRVRLSGSAGALGGRWAVAFAGGGADPVPLVTVPMGGDGDDAVATLLVPPEPLQRGQIRVVIAEAPGLPFPSDVRMAVDRALTDGRAAARLERVGRDAASRWRDSADRWEEAGDGVRAETARRYAGDGDPGSRGSDPRGPRAGRAPGTAPRRGEPRGQIRPLSVDDLAVEDF